MTSYQFGGALYRNSTDMHDGIARAWIGSGGEPDLATVLEVEANMEASLDEIEKAWELTPEHDTKTQQELSHLSGEEYDERLEEEGGLQGWDRDDFVSAVERLREELQAEADEAATKEWKTTRHLMLTIRNDDEDAEIAAHLPDDGIVSQQDYECADEDARQEVVERLEQKGMDLLGLAGTAPGDYTIMVLDYTDDGEDGLVLADVRETVDEIDEAA